MRRWYSLDYQPYQLHAQALRKTVVLLTDLWQQNTREDRILSLPAILNSQHQCVHQTQHYLGEIYFLLKCSYKI